MYASFLWVSGALHLSIFTQRLKGVFTIYPVRKPQHLWWGVKKKCSFLIEGEVQNLALSNGVY
jgi:hypothetical protein